MRAGWGPPDAPLPQPGQGRETAAIRRRTGRGGVPLLFFFLARLVPERARPPPFFLRRREGNRRPDRMTGSLTEEGIPWGSQSRIRVAQRIRNTRNISFRSGAC